jgi:hypothetical protein
MPRWETVVAATDPDRAEQIARGITDSHQQDGAQPGHPSTPALSAGSDDSDQVVPLRIEPSERRRRVRKGGRRPAEIGGEWRHHAD